MAPTMQEGTTVQVIGFGSTKQATKAIVGMTGTIVGQTKAGWRVQFEDGKTRTIGSDDLRAQATVLDGPSKTAVIAAVRTVRAALRDLESAYLSNDYGVDPSPLGDAVEALVDLAATKAEALSA